MQQYVLGVVSNVIHCFVGNLTDFPAVKEFKNRLRVDKIIVTRGWHIFLRHSVYCLVTEAHVCEQLAQQCVHSRHMKMEQLGVEPTTS